MGGCGFICGSDLYPGPSNHGAAFGAPLARRSKIIAAGGAEVLRDSAAVLQRVGEGPYRKWKKQQNEQPMGEPESQRCGCAGDLEFQELQARAEFGRAEHEVKRCVMGVVVALDENVQMVWVGGHDAEVVQEAELSGVMSE